MALSVAVQADLIKEVMVLVILFTCSLTSPGGGFISHTLEIKIGTTLMCRILHVVGWQSRLLTRTHKPNHHSALTL